MINLEKIYHIVGILQRIIMVILTFLMVGVAYHALSILIYFQLEIKEIHRLMETIYKLIELLYKLLDKSWFF